MHAIRVSPVILCVLLIAAHFMRFHGLLIPVLTIATIPLLFLKWNWIRVIWQLSLLAASIIWINTAISLISFRINTGMPYQRLTAILLLVILWNLFSALLMERKKIREYYQARN